MVQDYKLTEKGQNDILFLDIRHSVYNSSNSSQILCKSFLFKRAPKLLGLIYQDRLNDLGKRSICVEWQEFN
ncbi:MAG: hypothetical protein COT92_02605 [Candidatus Doudnabacteria bacterium CG10_big_fil_rev_8_21_14_0_10_42_18]|uniref:Uncharacterized protein n=1 Tax=Candidatus Doudnabacteria bacterium CG10_big_fil_rev_8_21_14_0_10_42_18 TaxID=1974552 RepID=A0A2H0VD06_9BACT|nr:MAG: hypothetical protein COT92_02605 [Candidatus Doudnabacteria bacterium CG10_big_fil_rev_8_21_14_0_10_42_18]